MTELEKEPLHRTKRVIYVVLLAVALLASGVALYNQFASDSQKQSLASQVNAACKADPVKARQQGLNCEEAANARPNDFVIRGPEGERGEKGDRGDRGTTGQQGPKGEKGDRGDKGDRGNRGDSGSDGAHGSDGSDGADGSDGESIVGPQGPRGETGPQGPKGDNGDRGADGAPADQITSVTIEGTPTACELRIIMESGNVFAVSVPGRLCIGG